MAPLEKPLAEKTYWGDERTVDTIGAVLTGIAAAGVAVHAVATKIRHRGKDKDAQSHNDDRMNTQEEKHD
jgi:Ni,Fe-hydrogenase I small subunit